MFHSIVVDWWSGRKFYPHCCPCSFCRGKLVWTSFSQIRTGLVVPQFGTFHYSGHGAYCMKCTSCAKRAVARMENEPVTSVIRDWCHVVASIFHWNTILTSYSWSLQQCNIVTSRFGNKHQVFRKRRMSVLRSRLWTNERVITRHTSTEHRACLPTILAPYAYEVFLIKIFQSSISHTLGSELGIFKISSISSTNLIITTAMLIHSAASLQVINNWAVLVVRRSLASDQPRDDYQ